eukprot:10582333-Ditylum_brightwellii.AAC.1
MERIKMLKMRQSTTHQLWKSQHNKNQENIMTTVILTRKQCLLQQRCTGHTTEELEPGENPTNQE